MRRITVFLLIFNIFVVSLYAGQATETKQIIVEDNYFRSNTYRIIQVKNGYAKITVDGRARHKDAVQSTKDVLRFPVILNVEKINDEFLMPSEIDGIVMDIPFNYYSSIESSARFFYTLLQNGWELEYYNATSLCIQIGLVNNQRVMCRLLVYADYLKVYCSLI